MPKFLAKRYLVIFMSVLAVFLIKSDQVEASVVVKRIFIDQDTIVRGYTVSTADQDFKIGVKPFVFENESWVKIVQLGETPVNPPQGKRLISSVYTYNISMLDPHVLEKPIIVALKYTNSLSDNRSLYFYNRVSGSWQPIPTSFDEENSYARAFIHFPYTTVAVFEEDYYSDIGHLDSQVAIVVNLENDEILYSKNIDEERSIASITKLMTAAVFLDQNINFDTQYTIPAEYSYGNTVGAKLYVREGETLTVGDLFFSMLVGSANNAAKALADATGYTQSEFVDLMNKKALDLEMNDTYFADPSGLDVNNIATAADLIKLSKHAFGFMKVLQGTTWPHYSFRTINTDLPHTIKTTNELAYSDLYLTGSKTGYLDEAGYCFVIKAKNNLNQEVIALVLGNPSWQDRFDEVEQLVYFGFNNL